MKLTALALIKDGLDPNKFSADRKAELSQTATAFAVDSSAVHSTRQTIRP